MLENLKSKGANLRNLKLVVKGPGQRARAWQHEVEKITLCPCPHGAIAQLSNLSAIALVKGKPQLSQNSIRLLKEFDATQKQQ